MCSRLIIPYLHVTFFSTALHVSFSIPLNQSINQSVSQSINQSVSQSINQSINQFTSLVFSTHQGSQQTISGRILRTSNCIYCRYSVRAAAACALGDDVTLWCHTASHQLSLADPANQRFLHAAQCHLASEHQQSRHAVHEQRGRPAQLGREAAFASGLASSSDDSSRSGDLNVVRNAEVNRDVQNGIASPHDEEAEGGKQTEQDCTATAEQLRMSSQGNDAGPGQGNCVPGQHFAALRQAPGVPGLYSHSSERLQKQPALELAAVHDNYAQAADHQDEQADHLAEQMPDFSDQADDHARQAGQNGAATQHINEQANYAAASLQPTTDAQEGWHKENAAQTQLKVRRLSLQLRQKLQVRMSLPQAASLAPFV